VADDIHLVRDLLDKQLVDRDGRRMGKVDGIVIHPRRGKAPRVAAIETGAAVLGARLHPALGRRVERLLARLTRRGEEPVRVPLEKILHRGLQIQVDLDARRTSALAVERWLAERIVGRIPGGRP
jgi:sporulation protein YlmC with PRC-barrel domain